MAKTILCDIVSAEELIYSGEVQMVVAAGLLGDLGIAPGHAALLTQLKAGPVRVVISAQEEQVFYVSGGMLEVQPDVVTVLADTALRAKDIDEAAAEEAKNKAQAQLLQQKSDIDYTHAAARLAEAAAQLRTIQQIRRQAGR